MNNQKKHVLLVTRNLPPLVGGMENLLFHCANTLHDHYSLTVVGPKGCSAYFGDSVNVHEVPRSLAGFLLLAPLRVFLSLCRHRFDLIFGGSGLMAPMCWLLGGLFRSSTLCYIHGLDIVVESRVYQCIFVPCVLRLDAIIVNSGNTRRLCVEAGVHANRITVIHPGCEVPAVVDRQTARGYLQAEYAVDGQFCVLFVGRVAPRKGLLKFVQQGFAELLRQRPDTSLVIVGDSPDDSLTHRSDELANLVLEVEKGGWVDRISFLGKVDSDTLSKCYAGADCLLFPLVPVAGDVEGFGMVAIESAAYGTPTVAFDEGGVSDAIEEGVSGSLVAPGDYEAMAAALAAVRTDEGSISACRNHARRFGWNVFDSKLLRKVNKTISNE